MQSDSNDVRRRMNSHSRRRCRPGVAAVAAAFMVFMVLVWVGGLGLEKMAGRDFGED